MTGLSRSALTVSLLYGVIGTLWIFSTYQYVRTSLIDPNQINLLVTQTLLRGFFIIFSTALLYFLIRFFNRKLERASDQNLRLFQENPHPMYVFDQETLRFLAVNNATVEKY